ncbi:MAG TPA: ATPase [Bacteroidales bacterium]|nr:ATPase [Bacteroidales bacterium]HQI44966.1 ATPase [Bacteroidales bacterium]
MIIVADSGATKTQWSVIYSRYDLRTFQTTGINPFFVDSTQIQTMIEKELVPYIDCKNVKEVFFYGAGCGSTEQCIVVEEGISPIFINARINIESDLLGAAKAICRDKEGIACILGTGSNSCLYDGTKITEHVPSLGYLLGDEGSGSYIGKMLLKEILLFNAPIELRELFEKKYNYTHQTILTHIYKQGAPSRFLASFMPFVKENIAHPFMKELVQKAFSDFFDIQILKYKKCGALPVCFVGSIAYHFSEILIKTATEKRLHVDKIEQSPIDGLTQYHLDIWEKQSNINYPSVTNE